MQIVGKVLPLCCYFTDKKDFLTFNSIMCCLPAKPSKIRSGMSSTISLLKDAILMLANIVREFDDKEFECSKNAEVA